MYGDVCVCQSLFRKTTNATNLQIPHVHKSSLYAMTPAHIRGRPTCLYNSTAERDKTGTKQHCNPIKETPQKTNELIPVWLIMLIKEAISITFSTQTQSNIALWDQDEQKGLYMTTKLWHIMLWLLFICASFIPEFDLGEIAFEVVFFTEWLTDA